MSDLILQQEQEIYANYVQHMHSIALAKNSELDELKLVGAFIKDQKISRLAKSRKPEQSIRDAAVEESELPFIKEVRKEA